MTFQLHKSFSTNFPSEKKQKKNPEMHPDNISTHIHILTIPMQFSLSVHTTVLNLCRGVYTKPKHYRFCPNLRCRPPVQ